MFEIEFIIENMKFHASHCGELQRNHMFKSFFNSFSSGKYIKKLQVGGGSNPSRLFKGISNQIEPVETNDYNDFKNEIEKIMEIQKLILEQIEYDSHEVKLNTAIFEFLNFVEGEMFPGITRKILKNSPQDSEKFQDMLRLQILGYQFSNLRELACNYHSFTHSKKAHVRSKAIFDRRICLKYKDRMLEIWDEFLDKYKEVSAKNDNYLDSTSMRIVKFYINNGNLIIDSLHKQIMEDKQSETFK
ncbi:hypothetical protein PGT21_007350 [Puccinia graminis f. sp. tritici]|uniref:Uncharacterized protein n=1 Tax=Puccinia graminis f. sp. tritici TaxID=56615 RepID=A0A5B0LMB5_PUCGR|nr:hypothetical protein PGT21_007350 [Puccinia graminis f. sp. tritici]